MYRIFVFLALFCLSLNSTFCQDTRQEMVNEILVELSALGNKKYSYFLNYIEEKSTLEFITKKDGEVKELYRLLIQDIHPEGLFLAESGDGLQLKILSKNHSSVFIYEKYRNGIRLSNNIKFIEFGQFSCVHKKRLKKVVQLLRKFIPKEEKIKPKFVDPPKTKRN